MKVHGEDHPSTADVCKNIAMVLDKKGDCDAAFVAYNRALELYVKVHGEDHPDTADIYNNISNVLHNNSTLLCSCNMIEHWKFK